ncbi:hypothetical protein ABW45_04525 [Stenotrophomonas maltophilia]|nr:hypothetical protein ABW45_04525 [Stenotrophomonas maltophilia]
MTTDKKTLADVQPGGRVRLGDQRSDLVPGIVRCAKCAFQLHRTNLYLQSGTVGAGDSKTEPCPNGCGPLWPVTWETWAREGWAEAERLHLENAALSAQPSPGGQGESLVESLVQVMNAQYDGLGYLPADVLGVLNMAVEALAASQPVGWQPMESAPKDGTVVLGLLEGSDIPQSIRFRDGWEIAWDGYRIPAHDGPLRWAPLYSATPAQQPAQVYLDGLDRALGEAIDQRDRYHEVADDLAGHIAAITGVDIGEHSSANCPWQNAIEAAEEYKPAQAVDLGRARASIQSLLNWIDDWAETPEESGIDAIEAEAEAVLALIDKAVGNG